MFLWPLKQNVNCEIENVSTGSVQNIKQKSISVSINIEVSNIDIININIKVGNININIINIQGGNSFVRALPVYCKHTVFIS